MTVTPTASATTAVRGASTSPPGGSVPPSSAITPRSPNAAKIPNPMPTTEAARPTAVASVAQRDIKEEVAHCVGGVMGPLGDILLQ